MNDNRRDAQCALERRGIRVRLRDLGKRTNRELANVTAWAEMGERIDTAPAWLRDRLAIGLASPIGGVCLQCGCTDEHACEDGCSWVDESHTRCSACPAEEQARRGGARS